MENLKDILKNNEAGRDTFFITVERACQITGLGRNTMLKLARREGFPAFRLPRKDLNW